MEKIKKEVSSFFEEVSKANESVFLILISLYVTIYFFLKIAWSGSIEHTTDMLRFGLLSIVMWGSTAYLFFIIAAWKNLWNKNIQLILVGIIMLACTGYFSTKMSTNLYGAVFDAFFCLIAYGKNYKKILKCFLGVTFLMLAIAAEGVPLGFTLDLEKPNYVTVSHSLGINYPNTWGYLVFLCLMLLWYLYLRRRPYITFPLFWGISWIMFKYISCNTIAALAVVFPVFALIVDLVEIHVDKKAIEPDEAVKKKKIGIFGWIIIFIPFIAFVLMLIASMNVEWMHSHFYGNRLRNFAMRFVQGGLYFRTYGFPLIGNPYKANEFTYVNVNGSFIKVGVLDSSFAAYMIMRGLIWMIYTLLWLCLANWKALKKRDYAIPFLGAVILLFAMMERPGLEMWYNFILLYPLAKVIGKPGTESVFEFGDMKKDLPLDTEIEEQTETIHNEKAAELPDTKQNITESRVPISKMGINNDNPEEENIEN